MSVYVAVLILAAVATFAFYALLLNEGEHRDKHRDDR